jgi:hypothetical protein
LGAFMYHTRHDLLTLNNLDLAQVSNGFYICASCTFDVSIAAATELLGIRRPGSWRSMRYGLSHPKA